ncbi:hypothetical protein [Streptomyces sp. NBC_00696]
MAARLDLKNDLDQIPPLVSDFGFPENKAVFHVEYELPTTRFRSRSC